MWLILHSGICFYLLLNWGLLRVFPRILFGFLSSLDRLSIRRKAEKSSDEIFSKGIFILLAAGRSSVFCIIQTLIHP